MNTGRLRGRTWPSALLAAVFALAVNLPNLGGPAPWQDEAATWVANQRSLPELISMLGHRDAVHGLYYVLMRAWQWVFADSIFSLRLASAVAVAVTAGLVVALGAAMFNLGVGRWAGLVYGLLPQATWAAGEARSYALTALAVTLAVIALWRALDRGSWANWVGYAAAMALSIHLFLFSALAFVALLAVVPAMPPRRRLAAALATAAAGIASLPVAVVCVGQAAQVAWLANTQLTVNNLVFRPFWISQGWPAFLGTTLLIIAGMAALSGLRDRQTRLALLTVMAWLLVPIALLAAAHLIKPVFHPRYLTFTAPALALLFGWAVNRIKPWWGRTLAALLVLAACLPPLVTARTATAKPGSVAPAVAKLAAASSVGDGLLLVGSDTDQPFWAFAEELAGLEPVGLDPDPTWRSRRLRPVSVVPDHLAPEFERHRRIWLFAVGDARGSALTEAEQGMRRLGYSTTEQIEVKGSPRVDVMLVERSG